MLCSLFPDEYDKRGSSRKGEVNNANLIAHWLPPFLFIPTTIFASWYHGWPSKLNLHPNKKANQHTIVIHKVIKKNQMASAIGDSDHRSGTKQENKGFLHCIHSYYHTFLIKDEMAIFFLVKKYAEALLLDWRELVTRRDQIIMTILTTQNNDDDDSTSSWYIACLRNSA